MKYLKPVRLYRELLKLKETGPLMGLTVANKCLGLSVSDDVKKYAEPLTILVTAKRSIDAVASQLHQLISRYSISGLVIGCPIEESYKRPFDEVRVKRFVDDLYKTGKFEDMNFTYWEECYTSKKIAQRSKPSRKLNEVPLMFSVVADHFAAFEVLQGYLDFLDKNQDRIFPCKER